MAKILLVITFLLMIFGLKPVEGYAQGCVSQAPSCGNPNGACHKECVAEGNSQIGRCRTVFDGPLACDNEDNNFPGCVDDGDICELADPGGSCERTPPKTGTNSVEGKIFAVEESDITSSSSGEIPLSTQKVKPLVGATIAWIEDPNLEDVNGNRKTIRRYTYNKVDSVARSEKGLNFGYYKLEGFPDEAAFFAVFCGSEMKVLKGVTWRDENDVAVPNVKVEPIYVKGVASCTDTECVCESNDVCKRQVTDKTDYENTCGVFQNQINKTPIKYFWDNVTPALNAAFTCLNNPQACINALAQNLPLLVKGAYVTPSRLTTDRAAFVEGTSTALGCDPSAFREDGLAASCDDIKEINLRFRGLNQGTCGGAFIKTINPDALKELVIDLYQANPEVCHDSDGNKVRARDFIPPVGIPSSELSSAGIALTNRFGIDFFPYYLLAPKEPDKAEMTPSLARNGDPRGSCSGYNCTPGTDPVDELRHTTEVKLRGGAFSPVATERALGSTASILTTPINPVASKYKPTSPVYNVHLFGEECDCEDRELVNGEPKGRCKQGGAKITVSWVIENALCASDPTAPGCSTSQSFKSFADVKLPRAKELGAIGGNLCDSLTNPAQSFLPNIGGLGTTTTTSEIRNSEVPTPYGVDGLGTVTASKECASEHMRIPDGLGTNN